MGYTIGYARILLALNATISLTIIWKQPKVSNHQDRENNDDSQSRYGFSQVTSLGAKHKHRMMQAIIHRILPKTRQSSVLLEAGPGRGEFADMILQQGYEYLGIEPSDELRQTLQSRGLTISAQKLPYIDLPDDSVDIVYSFDVLEHLDDHSVAMTFMSESQRVLRTGGHIVAIAPNAETLGVLFYLYEYQHSFFTTVYRLESMLKDSGFNVTSSGRFLSSLGLSENPVARTVDRLIAHIALFFFRSEIFLTLARLLLGESFVFRVHKNIYDHVFVVAKKAA